MTVPITTQAAGVTAPGTYRTGPLGRLARLTLAAVAGLSLSSIVDEGGIVGFRSPSILTEPSVWFLDTVMLGLFVYLVGQLATVLAGEGAARRWRFRALAALAAVMMVAAISGQAFFGAAWGLPLADLVWAFDVVMLLETIVAVLLAIALGTPGCEVGVWPELIARARHQASTPSAGPACIVGLHLLDAWEARRRAK